ncbi:hypothetical protein EV13_2139 [Prochlorococcus sp. MIT 0702]|nr:hypothetical protein EV13_2139 [Prochlorococcus sp. MIT 0702]KGG31910.1 hypothetical protein EV14_2118 [Prochlorococcus sp. MIT 0703]
MVGLGMGVSTWSQNLGQEVYFYKFCERDFKTGENKEKLLAVVVTSVTSNLPLGSASTLLGSHVTDVTR